MPISRLWPRWVSSDGTKAELPPRDEIEALLGDITTRLQRIVELLPAVMEHSEPSD